MKNKKIIKSFRIKPELVKKLDKIKEKEQSKNITVALETAIEAYSI